MAKRIKDYLNKNNLHHAYLIEGARDEVVGEVLEFVKSLGVKTVGNADVSHIMQDTFKIEDARNLKSYAGEKGYTSAKKIFIISANNFLLEAQNSLLKMLEEPIENTHFFLIVPDASALLKTFVSRFYIVSARQDLAVNDAEKFIKMPLQNRIDFIKELITEAEDEDEEVAALDSARSKSLKFLNALESVLHQKVFRKTLENSSVFTQPFQQIFKAREFLRQPGSSTKSLMES